ncbi:CheR family methyltransferase [Chryseolinea lacunae]|uniref:histidine kinase n=1 Tax=Chryseolinea lacunae TaxID=2801331 RepID=A0ABS1L2P4_9BACT|nr:CheR family methyltransferase [Chryseolinea lacunae]MBL0745723.1 hypothetical protein [Chryseolinea lacunae]
MKTKSPHKIAIRPRAGKPAAKNTPRAETFPIAAFGASAGGLEAFSELLKNLNCDLGVAYVFIMHLSPQHKSSLCEILQNKTKMSVHTVKNGMNVRPDNVYVIPPNAFMSLIDGHFKLSPRLKAPRGGAFAIDFFFTTLAAIYKNNSIGVILSGNATDGTLGLKAIKAEGGITFAQDDSAKFPGMPKNAYDSGYADFRLSPQKIAKEIALLTKIPYSGLPTAKIHEQGENNIIDAELLKKLLAIVKSKKGVDFFGQYKQAMIYRRVLRRVVLNKCKTLRDYILILESNEKEVHELYNDFLINVTTFFRDPEFFTTLEKQVLPALLKNRNDDDPIRIWIAGCATGEEAYSVAICLKDFLQARDEDYPFQIFASDLDLEAIEKARLGIYTGNTLQNVRPQQLTQYFKKLNHHYQIEKNIRELCIFSQHNLLKDPPFSQMDIISCQNVLIYLEPAPQQTILQIFHYALKPSGYLFLGKAETVAGATDLFDARDEEIKIYARRNTKAPWAQLSNSTPGLASSPPVTRSMPRQKVNIEGEMSKLLLDRFVWPSVILNQNLNIIQFYGVTSPYLGPLVGKASLNVLKMIQQDLLVYLRTLLAEARKTGMPASKDGIILTHNNVTREIIIEVVPKKVENEFFFLVVFKENLAYDLPSPGKKPIADQKSKIIMRLQGELEQSREVIRTTSEEYESTHEDLQAHTEELLSANEELKSTNEELETSKEELQSTNEELTSINEELERRNNELKASQSYAKAITDTVNSPFLVLTSNLQVKSANNSFYNTFQLTPAKTDGHSIFDLNGQAWDDSIVRRSLSTLLGKKTAYLEFEFTKYFPGIGELAFVVNMHKLTVGDNPAEFLILLALINISEAVRSNNELKKINNHLIEFTFGVSHDLQEPLRKIMTFANLLSGRKLSDEVAEQYVAKINRAVERVSTLVQATVQYSSLLKGHQQEFKSVDLNKTTKDICKDLELMIEEKHAAIHIEHLPVVNGEPVLLHQVFYNIIKNALKFSNKDPIIKITTERPPIAAYTQYHLKKGRHYVAIRIQDNGIGFDQQYADNIFSLYKRLDDDKKVKGAGMGLSICKKIVEDHEGAIFAKGIKNRGATFTILLPTP